MTSRLVADSRRLGGDLAHTAQGVEATDYNKMARYWKQGEEVVAHKLVVGWVGSGGQEAGARPTASTVRLQKVKASHSVVQVAQAGYIGCFVVRAALVGYAARSRPTIGVGSEGSVNGNESVRVSVGDGEVEAAVPAQ
jgi:hypothetical protein